MEEAVIVSGVRTAQGKFGGSLSEFSAPDLGSIVIKEAVKRANIGTMEIEEVIMGNVISAGLGQNVARQAAIGAGLHYKTGAFHVNEVCGSSLRAVINATQSIKAGDAKILVSGGMENMTNCPYLLDKARFGYRLFDGNLVDTMVKDGLWDVYNNFHMGMTGEITAQKYGITQEECDKFALRSHKKAAYATKKGKFKDEILPVEVNVKRGKNSVFDSDEGIREDTSLEKLNYLKPAFKKDGALTAGNSSQISDGAAAMVIMSKTEAEKRKIEPLAVIKGYNTCSVKPEDTMEAPITSVIDLFNRMKLSIEDIDLVEHNEAFSSASLAVMNELGINSNIFNVNGGAIALGHPIGASGARILITLINEMIREDKNRGLVTLCIGGGNAISMVIER